MGKKQHVSVLKLTAKKVRKFFLKEESYCNFDLPPYFVFDTMLNNIEQLLPKNNLRNLCNKKKLRESECVNYEVVSNKDGKLAWRPMQLIHPALYVDLVHTITDKKNWEAICDRFGTFSTNSNIRCLSLPVASQSKRKDKAELVLQWWQQIEQRSIELSLRYEYIAYTDITDCYGAIYTHSVACVTYLPKTG